MLSSPRSWSVLLFVAAAAAPNLGCSSDAASGDRVGGSGNGATGNGTAGQSIGGNAGTTAQASGGGGTAGSLVNGGTSGNGAEAGAGLGGSPSGGGGAGGAGAGGAGGSGGGMAGGGGAIDANGGAPAGPASGRQTARPAGSVQGTTSGYWEYLPPHYGNGGLYPLLVFMHGSGENGDGSIQGLQKVLMHGPPKLIKANQWPETRPFVVLSEQHAGSGATNCPSVQQVDDFLTFAMAKYAVDPKRIYMTGLSCGANATWDYLGAHTNEKVAATVPIAGDGRPAYAKIGCQLGKVPIWAFHGLADNQEAPAGSIDIINNLKACTNPTAVDVRITTYPGVPHDSWTMTYDLSNPANDIYAWMLTHSKT